MQEPNIIPMEFGLLIMLSHSFSKTHTLYLVEWRVLQLLFQRWCNVDSGCFWPSLPLFYFSLGNWTRKYQKNTKKYQKIGYPDQVYPCFKYLMPSLFITIVLLFLSQFFIMPMSKQDVAVDDVNSGAAAVATPQRWVLTIFCPVNKKWSGKV